MFTVTADASHHRVEFKVVGSMSDVEAAELANAIREAVVKAKAGSGSFTLLADMLEAAVLTQTVADLAKATNAWCAANGMSKMAGVISSALSRMQGARINAHDQHRTFVTREEAIAWLES